MPDDTSNPFASIIGALASKGGAKGVVKDGDGKVNPALTPNEVARYEKIFGIMKKVVNPGPETGQLDSSSSKVGSTAAMQKVASSSGGGGGFKMPGMGALAAIGGAAALIGAALTQMGDDFMARVDELTSDLVEFGDNAGDELGKLGAIGAKVAKFLPLKSLKMLPFIGSLVNFYFAFDHFKKGEYFDMGWELVSGIMNFLPGGALISPLMDGYKIYAEIIANKEEKETGKKPSFQDILGRQMKVLGGKIFKYVQEGKVPILSTFFKFGEGIGYMFQGKFSEGLESWSHILPSLLGGKDSPVYKYVSEGLGTIWALTKETGASALEKAPELAGNAWGWVTEVFSSIGEVFMGFFDGIKNWINDTLKKGKDLIWNMIPDVFKDQGLNEIAADPITYSKKSMKSTNDQLAAIRAKVGPEEFIRMMQSADKDAFLASHGFVKSESVQSKLKNIKDGFISKDGQVTAYDDQDDILAAKRGGPIDKMLDGNSAVMKSIASINAQQLNVLVEIREGIKSLSSGGGLSFSNTSLTQEFFE